MNILRRFLGSVLICSLVIIALSTGSASAQTGDDVGTVELAVVACPSITQPGLVTTVPDDCEYSGGTFSFYMRGDGTADYKQLVVDPAIGFKSMSLYPASYEVVEESTQTRFDVTVTANQNTRVTFAFPSENVAPWARVYLNNLYCETDETAHFLPMNSTISDADRCQVVDGTFMFTGTSDGATEFVTYNVVAGNENYVDLAPGTYTVTHQASGLSQSFDIPANDLSSIAFVSPIERETPTGNISITPVSCTDIEAASFMQSSGYMRSTCSFLPGQTVTLTSVDDPNFTPMSITPTQENQIVTVHVPYGSYMVNLNGTEYGNVIVVDAPDDFPYVLALPAKDLPKQTPAPSTAQPTPAATVAAVTSLPRTGAGESSATPLVVAVTATGSLLATAAISRLRHQA